MQCLENQIQERGIANQHGQINIKGFIKKSKVRYKSAVTLLDVIKNFLEKMQTDMDYVQDFGRALNEGLTEWMKQKCTGGYKSYENEVNIVEQIENAIGTKKVVEMVDRKPNEMKDIVNMDKKEFTEFCNKMDYVYFLNMLKNEIEDVIIRKNDSQRLYNFYEKEGKYLRDEIASATVDVQTMLLRKVIIPNMKKDCKNDYKSLDKSLKCIGLILEYCDEYEAFSKLHETEEYKEIKSIINKRLIQCASENIKNVDKWTDERVMQVYDRMIDYRHVMYDEEIIAFQDKIKQRISEIKLKEENKILDNVKHQISGKDKINIDIFEEDYGYGYADDINRRVAELVLNRKLTYEQIANLMREVNVYRDCGKVISKKDIISKKNDKGKTEYYVLVNGEKYTNYYLKKMKLNKKYLSSKKFEVDENEKEESDNFNYLTVTEEKSKIAKFIAFLKEKLSKKGNKAENSINKTDDSKENIDKRNDEFRKSLKVENGTDVHYNSNNIEQNKEENER